MRSRVFRRKGGMHGKGFRCGLRGVERSGGNDIIRNSSFSEGYACSKKLTVIPEMCSGCRLCELVCAIEHFGVNNPKKAAIRVMHTYPHPVSLAGPNAGRVVGRQHFENILSLYYQKRGWDKNGLPPADAEGRLDG